VADLIRLAYYPFLPEVRDVVRELGPGPKDLLTSSSYSGVRVRAEERVQRTFGKALIETGDVAGDHRAMEEILSHAVARMAIVCLGDRIVASRYASKEAARVRRALKTEEDVTIEEMAEVLSVPLDFGPNGWRVHFSDHLKQAPTRTEWKLVLQTLEAGWVNLDRRGLEGLVEEALRRRLESELHEEIKRGAPTDMVAMLAPILERLKPDLEEARKDWNTGDFGPVKEGAFPPCIQQLFEQMKAGLMIPHHGRFAFASFLGTIGMSADQILDYMTQIPNFSRDKSEYQIRHIAGELSVEAYTPPGCGTMQTNGICPLERRDEICGRIKHPLGYYRIKQKRMAPAVEDKTTKKEPPAEGAAA
jgi:DNA primase large subunit